MRTIQANTPVTIVLADPQATEVVGRIAPDALASPMLQQLSDFPVGPTLKLVLGVDDPRVPVILHELSGLEDPTPEIAAEAVVVPSPAYESPAVPLGSGTLGLPDSARVWERAEVVINGPSHGNPFLEVELTATFRGSGLEVTVGGFYDGDGVFRLRFLPPLPGQWTVRTSSNARSLDGLSGAFTVEPANKPGPVRAQDRGFVRADGSPFVPLGTTAYAWTHQEESLQLETLDALRQAPFNKLRMCLFPKSFMYNENEPARFVFPKNDAGGWDFTRFDLAYFAELEKRLDDLAELGIEADLILFHPYDRWGFAAMGEVVDDRYITYVVRRLAAFGNVWWSMANEYELLTAKQLSDWDRLANLVRANDPVGHPLSMHNWLEPFDCSVDWATHASIQGGGFAMGEAVAKWRKRWDKPIVVDEFGYEGDLEPGWGNLTGEEEVRRFWEGAMRGAFLTHGETFHADDQVVFWSKGGALRGDSVSRLAFLREIIEASPTGTIEPLPSDWDFPSAGVGGRYVLTYFGASRPRLRTIKIPEGVRARVDIIDTWNMTTIELTGFYSGETKLELPARPYLAIRATAVTD
jgi:hypothetical protein